MLTDGLAIRQITEEDMPAIIKLHQRCYGRMPDVKALRRRMNAWGAAFSALGFVAVAGGAIVASYTVFPSIVYIRGAPTLIAQSGDTMTAPEFSGRGLFTKLALLTYELCRQKGVCYVFGFPNRNSAPGFFRKLRWRLHGRIGTVLLPSPWFWRRHVEHQKPPLGAAGGASTFVSRLPNGLSYDLSFVQNKIARRGLVGEYRGVPYALTVGEFVHLCFFQRHFSFSMPILIVKAYLISIRYRTRGVKLQSYSKQDWFRWLCRETGYIGSLCLLPSDSERERAFVQSDFCFFDHDVF